MIYTTKPPPNGGDALSVRKTESSAVKPEFFRLPRPGEKDPYFGLSRSSYYELEKSGEIRLVRLRKRGRMRGTTLIPFDQVLEYVRSQQGIEMEEVKQ